jgi:hypothetical protein
VSRLEGAALGRVEAISIPGLDLWFNSADHLPPHFHARKPGRWEIRVYILECSESRLALTLKWPGSGGPRPRDQCRLLAATLAKREALLAEWERKVVFEGVL